MKHSSTEKEQVTLKSLRLENKKSRQEIATALNVSIQAVSHYENGIRKINIEQVLILSKLYECSTEEIIKAQLNSL